MEYFDSSDVCESLLSFLAHVWTLPARLKSVLARRTGRSEEELCLEERRRSARVAEEENFSLEESGLVLERGSRRGRKEEPKLSDVRIFSLCFRIKAQPCCHIYVVFSCYRVRALTLPAFLSLKGK